MRHASINVLPCCLEGCGILGGSAIILEGRRRKGEGRRREEERGGERKGEKRRGEGKGKGRRGEDQTLVNCDNSTILSTLASIVLANKSPH